MSARGKKLIEVVAGPNGSGKSTFARAFLTETRKRSTYLNPDLIATGLSPQHAERESFQAGRLLLTEIKARLSRGESFAFETTLSGRAYAKMLSEAKDSGYTVVIYFLYLDSVKRNLRRIRERVRAGGHDIPKEAVLRSQRKCFDNFWDVYRILADAWYVFDNSGPKPELLISHSRFDGMSVEQQSAFAINFAAAGKSDV